MRHRGAVARCLIPVVLLAAVAGCAWEGVMVGEEVTQTINPFSSIKLLVTRDPTGIYRVYGAAIEREVGGTELFRTNARDGVAMDWVSENVLKLTITCGKVIMFKNVFDITDDDDKVDRRLMLKLDAVGPVNCL